MAEAKVFQHRQVNETRRPDPVTVRTRASITDQIKSQLALRPFDPAIRFPDRRLERAHFYLRIHDRPGRNLFHRLVKNAEALAHFERAQHQAIVAIAVVAERYPELEARIDAVAVYFAEIVVYAAGSQHGSGDTGIDRQLRGKLSHVLGARDQDFVRDN